MKWPFDPRLLDAAMALFTMCTFWYVLFGVYLAWVRLSFLVMDVLTGTRFSYK